MPSQSVWILLPLQNISKQKHKSKKKNVSLLQFSEEDFREKIEGPTVTNARGMYPGYQRLFLVCDDYNKDLTEPETAWKVSDT